jgi:hypothetical protein
MKSLLTTLLVLALAGCATTGAPVVPELGNRPRVPINTVKAQTVAAAPAAASSVTSPEN